MTALDEQKIFNRHAAQALVLLLMGGIFLFLPAGTLAWGMGWVMLAVYVSGIFLTSALLARFRPELAKERLSKAENIKPWDMPITTLTKILSIPVMLTLAGLDRRFSWSSIPQSVQFVGLIVFVLGFVWTGWAMFSNAFFSSSVRIQVDRGHHVASDGPYRYVRHPGYAAMIAQFVAMPLGLGSAWALLPSLACAGLYILRTALEDLTLQNELPGYKEYARTVRYRLLPGVW